MTLTEFSDFGLAAPLLGALTREGYTTPTPIQEQAIPKVMEGHDILGIAQTGTGKTAAFALPTLHRFAQDRADRMPGDPRVLVLAPTRELVCQIAKSFEVYGKDLSTIVYPVYGGVKITQQIRRLKGGIDILIAAPGRMLDLVNRGELRLDKVEVLILDEADQMMDLGFIHDLRRIAKMVPKQRQTLFFSATMPPAIEKLSQQFVTNPVKVAVVPQATTAERIEQSAYGVPVRDKPELLSRLLRDTAIDRTIVFTRTKHGADKVVRRLKADGIYSVAIHGNKTQGQRQRALSAFKAGNCRVLIATDIAARGIDVTGVSHVFNYDLPNVPEQYVHRIGRSGRAGRSGIAISLVGDDERQLMRPILRVINRKMPLQAPPTGEMPEVPPFLGLPAVDPTKAPEQAQGKPAAKRRRSKGPSSRGRGPVKTGEGAPSADGRRSAPPRGGEGRPADGTPGQKPKRRRPRPNKAVASAK